MNHSQATKKEPRLRASALEIPAFEVLIIGTGFGGLAMAAALLKEGRTSFVMLERAGDVGGTWRDNTYPGCACDIPSHLYSFSFAQNPQWSHLYPQQPEIWQYLRNVADRYGVRAHIRFNKTVSGARFDAAAGLWRVHTADGEVIAARVLVAANGGLSQPQIPRIDGLEIFQGKTFHSAQWDHGYALAGKHVGVIGTGASAVQFVPQIAPQVAALKLFQRSPPWIVPRMDRVISAQRRAAYARHPLRQKSYRLFLFLRAELLGGAGLFRTRHMAGLATRAALKHLQEQVPDPVLRKALTPNYDIGCKRILLSNDYYPAISRPNVQLITAGITRITERGLLGSDGREHAVDCIIFGTGFDVHGKPLDIRGLHGRSLIEEWEYGRVGFRGIAVSGYPNLFLIAGPNSGTGHNSMVYVIESQVRYIMDALHFMEESRLQWLAPNSLAQYKFNAQLQYRLKRSVWAAGGCNSWYRDGQGRITTLWPGLLYEYRKSIRRVNPADYDTLP